MHKHIGLIALLLLFSAAVFRAQAAPVLTNGGFETGDFTGWTLAGTDSSASGLGIYYGVDAADAHTGSSGAYFGSIGGVLTLSQVIATTPGKSYAISFWLAQAIGEPAPPYVNSFSAVFGGTSLVSQTNVPGAAFSLYSYSGVATTSTTLLQFSFRNDTGFFSLDDVDVASPSGGAPEPATLFLAFPLLLLFAARHHRLFGHLFCHKF